MKITPWKNKKIKFIEHNQQKFKISSIKLIICAYFIDFIINFVFSLLLMLLLNNLKFLTNHYHVKIIIMLIFNIVFLFTYFILIPFWRKYTLGRWICRIKLINLQFKLKLKILLIRELIVIIIPYFFLSIFNFIILWLYKINIFDLSQKILLPKIIVFLITFFNFSVLIYYLFLLININLDKNHQIGIDDKFNLFFLKLVKTSLKAKKNKKPNHIHLQSNLPGNISFEELEKIKNLKKY